ncbi:MAG TPA: nuclear transport factor 2 family protein [Candidatus Dormibacteraeota bacterium]|jgi:2-(1,2-epoxy-1,2-dihydrophenyl)acetyl-CoA isomerase
MTAIRDLVRGVYAALAEGDAAALGVLLDPGFEAEVSEGMPLGCGGRRTGAEAMIRDTWWAIGRTYRVRPEAREWIACEDGRLVVLGRYLGRCRSTGQPLDAAFAHLWTAGDGRLTGLMQVTDTALWAAALEQPA